MQSSRSVLENFFNSEKAKEDENNFPAKLLAEYEKLIEQISIPESIQSDHVKKLLSPPSRIYQGN